MAPRMTKPLDARIVRTRARLHEAMLDLLGERRFEDITALDIVERAGIGYATFFRHYPDKLALMNAILDDNLEALDACIHPMLGHSTHTYVAEQICQLVDRNRDTFRTLFVKGATDHARQWMLDRGRSHAAEMSGPPLNGLPRMLSTNFGVTGLFSILSWWLDGHDNVPAAKIAEALDYLVFAPLFANPRVV